MTFINAFYSDFIINECNFEASLWLCWFAVPFIYSVFLKMPAGCPVSKLITKIEMKRIIIVGIIIFIVFLFFTIFSCYLRCVCNCQLNC